MPDGTEPVDQNERIYRRVHAGTGYYKPNKPLSPKAFKPLSQDTDGVSVTRAGYVSGPQEAAALGTAGKSYYVLEQRAGDLMASGLTIQPSPIAPDDLGHAVIPEINILKGENDPTLLEKMDSAKNVSFVVHGPFPGTKPPPTG
jgi:hypothetical protein